ncbi:24808_t:CDS:2, partial [Racocetra persica]
SSELTKFSNNESTETMYDNKQSISDTGKNLSHNSNSISDGYRSLLKASASKLATTYLDASKSSMIRFINPTLVYIKQDLYSENLLSYNLLNFEILKTAFDDEINKENKESET